MYPSLPTIHRIICPFPNVSLYLLCVYCFFCLFVFFILIHAEQEGIELWQPFLDTTIEYVSSIHHITEPTPYFLSSSYTGVRNKVMIADSAINFTGIHAVFQGKRAKTLYFNLYSKSLLLSYWGEPERPPH